MCLCVGVVCLAVCMLACVCACGSLYVCESRQARERVASLKADNDKVLAAHLVRLGFAR
jgi:hypothetical protein